MNEIEQLKKDILKLEFQHKKDIIESNKRCQRIEKMQEESQRESQARLSQIERLQRRTQAQIDHIAKLTGIAFENFEDIDTTFEKVSKAAARKRKV